MSPVLAHLLGDYVVQNEHMAVTKVRTPEAPGGAAAAVAHAATYTACHVPLTRSVRALAVMGGTHYVIDRYRLAKRVVWARNQIAPLVSRYAYEDAGPFGEKDGSPAWLAGWLLFLCDNTMHLAINEWALRRWPSGGPR